MKLIITMLFSLFISSISFAQRVTINQMMKIQTSNVVDAEDLLLGLGFKLSKDLGKIGEYDSYTFHKGDIYNSKEYHSITKNIYQNKNIEVSFFTLSDTDYASIKKSLSTLGYKFKETIKSEKSITHIFESTNGYSVNLVTSPHDGNTNMYNIYLKNNKNQDYYFQNTIK